MHKLVFILFLIHSLNDPFADWMLSLQRPDMPGPCCGPGDQVYVDDYQEDPNGDGFIARINGITIHIPKSKVIWDKVNPTGRGVLFYGDASHFVFCFVPGVGA